MPYLNFHLRLPPPDPYSGGHSTREWMAPCDRNYITRLERNGCTNETEESDLAEWRERHVADYAKGPQSNSGEADSEAARGDYVRARYDNDPPYRSAIDNNPETEAGKAFAEQERAERERAVREAKEQETQYQKELKGYRDLLGPGLVEAIKAKASERLISDLLKLDPQYIDGVDENGQTALHVLAERGDLEALKRLIKTGADATIEDGLDQTPRGIAKANKHMAVAQALKLAEKKTTQSPANSLDSSNSKHSGSTDLPSPSSSLGASGGGVMPPAPPAATSPSSAQSWQIASHDLQWNPSDSNTRLGGGGSGYVYKGRYTQARGFVAIKALHPFRANAASVEELRQEAAMMASLRSDYVVHFYGVCQWSSTNQTLLVMECCSHGSLYDYLHPEEKNRDATPPELTWSTRYELARDISCGLDYLHRHNPVVLHRDLKSLNVLLTEDRSGQLQAKLTDFGLAKMKNESSTQSNTPQSSVGTIPWMAPELLIPHQNQKLAPDSVRTDVYALGMVLWELASKQAPFTGMREVQIIGLLMNKQRPAIPENTPAPYSALIQRCWTQRAEERPAAGAVIQDINKLIAEGSQSKAATEAAPLEHNRMLFSS